jgi:hypothetical protein
MGKFKEIDIAQREANDDLLVKHPLIEGIVFDIRSRGVITTDHALIAIKDAFDYVGPFKLAQQYGVLKNESGEEFAIQFMSFWNEYTDTDTY